APGAGPARTWTHPASSPGPSSAALLPLCSQPRLLGTCPRCHCLCPRVAASQSITITSGIQHGTARHGSARSPPWLHWPHGLMQTPRSSLLPSWASGNQRWHLLASPPSRVPVSCHRSQEPCPLWWDVILQDGAPTDQAAHKALAAPNAEGGRPGWVCRVPVPPASLQPRRKRRVPITSAFPGGHPKSLARIVGAAETSEVQSSWFTLQEGHPRGGREGEKCKDPARRCRKGMGAGGGGCL
ncbi:hypothetical protein Nmel_018734, partial [Mimus melanotis]